MALPSLPNAQISQIRAKTDKGLQHYNYVAAQVISLKEREIRASGEALGREMTNRLNQESPENNAFRCHARTLLNARVLATKLKGKPITENEPYYFYVRYKHTPNREGGYNYYFNCDLYLPARGNEVIEELCHISLHTSPYRPLYKKIRGRMSNQVDETGVFPGTTRQSPTDAKGIFHLIEGPVITANPNNIRRYAIVEVPRPLPETPRLEIILVKQTGVGNTIHPLSIRFSNVCLEVIQTFLDTNYSVAHCITPYNGPKDVYTKVKSETLPRAPDMRAMIAKDKTNGFDWDKLVNNHKQLESELTARINRSPNALKMKMNGLDLYVKEKKGGNYGDLLKSISFLSASVPKPAAGVRKTILVQLNFNIWDGATYKTVLLSKMTFTNTIPVGMEPAYKGYMFAEDYLPAGHSARYFTLNVGTNAKKKIEPLYQIGDLTSVTVEFGTEAAKVVEDFINAGYDPAKLTTSYYDCAGVGSDAAIAPPVPLPRYGGRRITRINRRQLRKTRKNKKTA